MMTPEQEHDRIIYQCVTRNHLCWSLAHLRMSADVLGINRWAAMSRTELYDALLQKATELYLHTSAGMDT